MGQKSWLWRKKSSEETFLVKGKSGLHTEANVDEVQSFPSEKEAELEKSVSILNEKLASLLSDCNVKDELLASYEKRAQEALEGKEKSETELLGLRKCLNEALQQKSEANERIRNLNCALKDSMQQLSFTKNEQEQRVHEAVMRTTKELEKAHKRLEENLSETGKEVKNLIFENARVTDSLLAKESQLKDLSYRKAQLEAEFAALMSRLDFVEKENAFFRYELRVFENDLDIRNQEIELSRFSTESLQKQQLEYVKKIKKLEAECQRLRILVRKRQTGQAALSNMRIEVESQARYQIEARRRNLNPMSGALVVRGSRSDREDLDLSKKRISFLVERLQNVEKENELLRDILSNKDRFVQTSHRISQEPADAVSNSAIDEFSSLSGSNFHEESDTNRSPSWASALISQLDSFRGLEPDKTSSHDKLGISDMNLMDDFVEMEKLAIVAVDAPQDTFSASSHIDHVATPKSVKKDLCLNDVGSTGKELVPIGYENLGVTEQPPKSNLSSSEYSDWLQDILKAIYERVQVSERNACEILEDIKAALHSEASKASDIQPIMGYLTWKSPAPSPRASSFHGVPITDTLVKDKGDESIHRMTQSVSEIIELVKTFGSTNSDNDRGQTNRSEQKDEDYVIHAFGWKSSDLVPVLQQFVDTCNQFLDGEVDYEKLAAELSSAMGWILGNCITTNGNNKGRYELWHHFGQCGSGSDAKLETMQKVLLETKAAKCFLEIENEGLKAEVEQLKTLHRELELSVQSSRDGNEALSRELQQSHESIKGLQTELEIVRVSKQMIEDQFENQKMINEEIDTQLNLTKSRLNDVSQKLASLEVEFEDKSHSCQELEGTCLELQLQLESITSKVIVNDNMNQEGKLLQTGWEIKAASVKLAECEAAILSLGSQLQGLTPSNGTSRANNVLYTHKKCTKKLDRRFSLLDQMLSEDGDKVDSIKSPKARENSSATEGLKEPTFQRRCHSATTTSSNQQEHEEPYLNPKEEGGNVVKSGAMVVIPGKKRLGGFSFVRKLLLSRNQSSRKKTSYSFAF